MTEVPKIVHHRLRAATPALETLEQMHPEADILTAFAEQALSTTEREGVLQHLALCADCRDIVALALPAMDANVRPLEVEEEVEEENVTASHAGAVPAAGARNGDSKSRFAWAGFGWGHLRWATLAAGIAVAVFVVRPAMERIRKPHTPVNSAVNQISPAAQSAPSLQIASGALPENSADARSAVTDAEKGAAAESSSNATADSKAANNQLRAKSVENKTGANETGANMTGANLTGANKTAINGRPVPSPQPPLTTALSSEQSDMRLVGGLGAAGDSRKQSADRLKKGSVSAGMAAAPSLEFRAPDAGSKSEADKSVSGKSVVGSSSEVVEVVAGAATEVETLTEEVSSAGHSVTARADRPTLQDAPAVIKSKPALDETVTRDAAVPAVNESVETSAQKALTSPAVASSQAEVTSKARTGTFAMKAAAPSAMQKEGASWTIADGVLQRSIDGGHTWQTAARADHALLCYANRGQEVWAGGQAGTVLHSVDNGATWSAIAVSFNGQQLSSDVTHLDMRLILRPPVEIVLSTDTHETWNSTDGGKTWEKK